MNVDIKPCTALRGTVRVPGDKSISHRALIFGAIAKGMTRIANINPGLDVSSTATCLLRLGVDIRFDGRVFYINGKGYFELEPPKAVLDAGNSGTTMRLLAGILAAQDFSCTITGDASLCGRPMRRIMEPLQQMGADIESHDGYPPLSIHGRELICIDYVMPVASAQVKSCLLLAGLGAWGITSIQEQVPTRDHSERLLRAMGAPLSRHGDTISIHPVDLHGIEIKVPGDLSAAAFLIAAALLVPGSDLHFSHVGINPTRTGFIQIIRKMGGHVKIRELNDVHDEPVANLRVQSCGLKAAEISGPLIPRMIDEIPILAVLATQALGQTVIRDAAELRVKESDRLHLLASNLRKIGAEVEELADGLAINGPTPLRGAEIDTAGDHRLAMAFTIAGLIARGSTRVTHAESVQISHPDFFDTLSQLGVDCG